MNTHPTAQAGHGWAVSTPHSAASDAAARMFAAGGNAVDAALAAAAMLAVVYPNQCSLGGDLIALVGTPDGEVRAVNASGRAPLEVDAAALVRRSGSMPVSGAFTVTVPGVVSGWEALRQRWGTRPLADALADAEAAAREGIEVSAGLARDLDRDRVRIEHDPGLRGVFGHGGEVLRRGAPLRQPELAASLALLSSDGPAAMYEGVLGKRLVAELRARGSAMSEADFAGHRADLEPAVGISFAGTEFVSTAGNSQGTFFLAGLAALEHLRASGHDIDPLGESAGPIACVLARAAAARDRLLGDPADDSATGPDLVSDELVQSLLRPGVSGLLAARVPAAHGDTAAVSAADHTGLWVALLQSVFHAFGSGILEPRTGIVLHNRGASFTLREGAPNQLKGGRRPPHTLMPVITRGGGRITGCQAVMGGRAQPQIQTHIIAALAAGAGLDGAVSRPRWVLGALEAGQPAATVHTARLEPDVPERAARSIAASGFAIERMARLDDEAGHATAIRLREEVAGEPVFEAAADPRADGSALTGPRALG